eukprot:scaffold235434_cov69-Attheya_sp.AAC.1
MEARPRSSSAISHRHNRPSLLYPPMPCSQASSRKKKVEVVGHRLGGFGNSSIFGAIFQVANSVQKVVSLGNYQGYMR